MVDLCISHVIENYVIGVMIKVLNIEWITLQLIQPGDKVFHVVCHQGKYYIYIYINLL